MRTAVQTSDRQRLYTILAITLAALCSQITFQGARMLGLMLTPTDLSSAFDDRIPFIPWTVTIYVGTFVFWAVCLYSISKLSRPLSDRFFCGQHIAYFITFFIFLFFPTTNTRPEFTVTNFWEWGMSIVYMLDPPYGLFPSLHCLTSWMCWAGIRGRKEVPLGYRIAAFIIAAAICVSTMTTKQHVAIDVIGGISLCELSYLIAGNSRVLGLYTRTIDRLIVKIMKMRQPA